MKALEWLAIVVLSVVLYTQIWKPLYDGFRSPFGAIAETLDKAVEGKR